jgi:glycosyltransferase involved in cell wall biosynthesis
MPAVSVVLPVFNAADTIDRALRSILDQSLRDLEVIVVDDGSADNSVSMVRRFTDARLRCVQVPHGGVAVATNIGTELAESPIIARMDADDFAYPQRLEKQRQLLQENNLDVVGSMVRITSDTNSGCDSMRRYERWINEETMVDEQIRALRFVEFPLVNPTIMARRSYFELQFGDNGLPEDYDLMLRAAAQGARFGKVDEVLLDWTDHPGRLTRVDSRYSLAAFMSCRRRHLLDGPLINVSKVDLWGVGQTGKPWLRWLQANGIEIRRAFDVNRRKVNATIHGVAVVHPSELPRADGTPLIIAVGAEDARQVILPQVVSRGYKSGRDAWFVA